MEKDLVRARLIIEGIVQGVVFGRRRGFQVEWQQRGFRASLLHDPVICAFEFAQGAAEQADGRALAREREAKAGFEQRKAVR